MKINKKVLIPVFATAMGLSVIGGISGAVAWYQYNTKVTASFMGVTSADGGVLQVSDDNGVTWKRDIDFGSASSKLHPVTYGALAADAALPSSLPKRHPECGVTNPEQWDDARLNVDYFQKTFKIKAQKLVEDAYVDVAAQVNLKEFILESITSGKTDVTEAVRIHISNGSSHKLFSLNAETTAVSGELDLDGDTFADKKGGYVWDEHRDDVLTYGVSGNQVSNALAADTELFTVAAGGSTITITVWLEGWQKLRSAERAMWDPSKDEGATIHLGLTLATPKTTFITD